jgi:ArsR family transcriptional regulator
MQKGVSAIMDYENYAKVAKALSDPKRIKILDMLSCGAMCACDILEHFDFTQPTLSHHINLLVKAGLVTTEKSGTWHYYKLNMDIFTNFKADTAELMSDTPACICEPFRSKAACETKATEAIK